MTANHLDALDDAVMAKQADGRRRGVVPAKLIERVEIEDGWQVGHWLPRLCRCQTDALFDSRNPIVQEFDSIRVRPEQVSSNRFNRNIEVPHDFLLLLGGRCQQPLLEQLEVVFCGRGRFRRSHAPQRIPDVGWLGQRNAREMDAGCAGQTGQEGVASVPFWHVARKERLLPSLHR